VFDLLAAGFPVKHRAAGLARLRIWSRLPGLLALAASLALAACGGGGGGGGGSNKAPVASFTVTPFSGTAPLLVTVNGSASSDPDGTISSYAWNFGDSSSGSGVSTTHTYTTGGSYTITLTVTDNKGKTGTTTRVIRALENQAPSAAFTVSQAKITAPAVVSFDASASADSDGTIANYSWEFGDGGTASGVVVSHTFTTGGIFVAKLTVTDNLGKQGNATSTILSALPVPSPSVIISGKVTYDRVPFWPVGSSQKGLNYSGTFSAPARGIVVELLKSDDSFLAATTADSQGNYSFVAPQNMDVYIRARAQALVLDSSGSSATWNLQVKNNTNSNALYAMKGGQFNTGVSNQNRGTMNADSGWPGFNGTSYTGPRVAAPFAILDTLYTALQFVVTQGTNPSIALPALDVYWSPSNKAADGNPATGQITTTWFQPAATSGGFLRGIYVLGDDGNDTDEYDEHVLTHEFQHYLQDVTSRDDTVGGLHSLAEKLDLRVAFSEGYANAFSGMALNDPVYRDSSGSKQGSDFNYNLESLLPATLGWYSESTISRLVWDLFDTAQDANDKVSLPYASIATVFQNQLRTGQPLTSVFPLIVALKAGNPSSAAAIDTLVTNNGMLAHDAFGSTETNPAGNPDALPIYANIALNGSAVHICGNQGENNGLFNKLGNRRFLKFSLNATVNATIHAQYSSVGSDAPTASAATPDPDLVLFKGGQIDIAESDTANQENLARTLGPGDYVIEIYEYSHIEAPKSPTTSRGRTCFDVTITG
jgi:PKD repeat protein